MNDRYIVPLSQIVSKNYGESEAVIWKEFCKFYITESRTQNRSPMFSQNKNEFVQLISEYADSKEELKEDNLFASLNNRLNCLELNSQSNFAALLSYFLSLYPQYKNEKFLNPSITAKIYSHAYLPFGEQMINAAWTKFKNNIIKKKDSEIYEIKNLHKEITILSHFKEYIHFTVEEIKPFFDGIADNLSHSSRLYGEEDYDKNKWYVEIFFMYFSMLNLDLKDSLIDLLIENLDSSNDNKRFAAMGFLSEMQGKYLFDDVQMSLCNGLKAYLNKLIKVREVQHYVYHYPIFEKIFNLIELEKLSTLITTVIIENLSNRNKITISQICYLISKVYTFVKIDEQIQTIILKFISENPASLQINSIKEFIPAVNPLLLRNLIKPLSEKFTFDKNNYHFAEILSAIFVTVRKANVSVKAETELAMATPFIQVHKSLNIVNRMYSSSNCFNETLPFLSAEVLAYTKNKILAIYENNAETHRQTLSVLTAQLEQPLTDAQQDLLMTTYIENMGSLPEDEIGSRPIYSDSEIERSAPNLFLTLSAKNKVLFIHKLKNILANPQYSRGFFLLASKAIESCDLTLLPEEYQLTLISVLIDLCRKLDSIKINKNLCIALKKLVDNNVLTEELTHELLELYTDLETRLESVAKTLNPNTGDSSKFANYYEKLANLHLSIVTKDTNSAIYEKGFGNWIAAIERVCQFNYYFQLFAADLIKNNLPNLLMKDEWLQDIFIHLLNLAFDLNIEGKVNEAASNVINNIIWPRLIAYKDSAAIINSIPEELLGNIKNYFLTKQGYNDNAVEAVAKLLKTIGIYFDVTVKNRIINTLKKQLLDERSLPLSVNPLTDLVLALNPSPKKIKNFTNQLLMLIETPSVTSYTLYRVTKALKTIFMKDVKDNESIYFIKSFPLILYFMKNASKEEKIHALQALLQDILVEVPNHLKNYFIFAVITPELDSITDINSEYAQSLRLIMLDSANKRTTKEIHLENTLQREPLESKEERETIHIGFNLNRSRC